MMPRTAILPSDLIDTQALIYWLGPYTSNGCVAVTCVPAAAAVWAPMSAGLVCKPAESGAPGAPPLESCDFAGKFRSAALVPGVAWTPLPELASRWGVVACAIRVT